MSKNILCIPFDPVHDVGIKIIKNELDKHGHKTELLPPDLPVESIVKKASVGNYDFILVSRTLGYGVAELLAQFMDKLDVAGVRDKATLVLGGKPVTPELAAELGFDKGFGEHNSIEEVLAYIEGREYQTNGHGLKRERSDFTKKYDYHFLNNEVESLLESIADKTIKWSKPFTSPGIERSRIKEKMLHASGEKLTELQKQYYELSDPAVNPKLGFFMVKGVRTVTEAELEGIDSFVSRSNPENPSIIQHAEKHPLLFKFLGSGCPVMDLMHAKICERYGINGFLIINPSWEARYEGLLSGTLTHENDGTITSIENIRLIKKYLDNSTHLTVRAHRGLNTPETVLLAGEAGANMAKINLVYGSLGAGTDPARLAVDGIEAINLAAKYNMPFDIPGNDELSGVPAWKSLAGLLINVMLGIKLNASPILKPLFCYGPHIVINKFMEQNYIDYNAAKIMSLRSIVNAPIWPGEPIAFMTQSEERVQSANATSYHAALAASLGVDAITIASTDEAYSRGPISITSRIDSINAVKDAYRFLGNSSFNISSEAENYKKMITQKIIETLREVDSYDNLPEAINKGALGNKEDGAYPGKFGAGSITRKTK
jgi:methylmalonyl-CoA mutase cobalamin-binding subunit